MIELGPLLIQHRAYANTDPPVAEGDLVAHFIARVLAAVPPPEVRRLESTAVLSAHTADWLDGMPPGAFVDDAAEALMDDDWDLAA